MGLLRPLDEDELAFAGIEVERGHAFDAVDEWVEVGGLEVKQVHRQRAGLDVHAAELLGLAERLGPAGLSSRSKVLRVFQFISERPTPIAQRSGLPACASLSDPGLRICISS